MSYNGGHHTIQARHSHGRRWTSHSRVMVILAADLRGMQRLITATQSCLINPQVADDERLKVLLEIVNCHRKHDVCPPMLMIKYHAPVQAGSCVWRYWHRQF